MNLKWEQRREKICPGEQAIWIYNDLGKNASKLTCMSHACIHWEKVMDSRCARIAMLVMGIVSIANGFQVGRDANDYQQIRNLHHEIPRSRSSSFLRGLPSIDNSQLQDDDDSNDQEPGLRRRDMINATHYTDRKGRICVLCKWGIAPCCAPNFCKKHHIRFNECVEVASR